MKIELDIKERLGLIGLLPNQGDMLTLKVIKSILDKIEISSEEGNDVDLRMIDLGNGKVRYEANQEKITEKGNIQIEFSEPEMQVIKSQYDTLNNSKKLSIQDLSLWEKLTGGK